MRRFSVDTSHIVRGKGRVGIYFVEPGANQRASKVVYDREYSAIALAKPGDIDWNAVFEGAGWFHTTGITPAISASAADLALESVKAAQAKGFDEPRARMLRYVPENADGLWAPENVGTVLDGH